MEKNYYRQMFQVVRYFVILLTVFSFSNCASADPDRTSYRIKKNAFSWNMSATEKMENDKFRIRIIPSNNQEGALDAIYYEYVKDGDEAALEYLKKKYDIYLLEILNKNENPQEFQLGQIKLGGKNCSYRFASSWSLPKETSRLNPKGMTKNLYNTIVTVVIVAAFVASVALPPIPMGNSEKIKEEKKSNEGEDHKSVDLSVKKTKEYWSSIFHDTEYHYDDIISEKNMINGLSMKRGIVFLEKDASVRCKSGIMLQKW